MHNTLLSKATARYCAGIGVTEPLRHRTTLCMSEIYNALLLYKALLNKATTRCESYCTFKPCFDPVAIGI